jgi:hypothetical protein
MRYMGGGIGHFHTTLTSTNYSLANDEAPGAEDIPQPEQMDSESDSDQDDETMDYDEAIEEDYDM